MSSVYDDLRRDYPELAEFIDSSEERGNAHYQRPFDPARKDSWLPDVGEEQGDTLVYLRAEREQIGDRARVDPAARERLQIARRIEERTKANLHDLLELRKPWPSEPSER